VRHEGGGAKGKAGKPNSLLNYSIRLIEYNAVPSNGELQQPPPKPRSWLQLYQPTMKMILGTGPPRLSNMIGSHFVPDIFVHHYECFSHVIGLFRVALLFVQSSVDPKVYAGRQTDFGENAFALFNWIWARVETSQAPSACSKQQSQPECARSHVGQSGCTLSMHWFVNNRG
jgi:hypothetical protein